MEVVCVEYNELRVHNHLRTYMHILLNDSISNCTVIYGHSQSSSQRSSSVDKGRISQESTRYINTTIDTIIVYKNLWSFMM